MSCNCSHNVQAAAKKVGLSDSNAKYFALFLRAEHDFGKTELHFNTTAVHMTLTVYMCTCTNAHVMLTHFNMALWCPQHTYTYMYSYDVDRKIQDNEFPHQLYVQNYSSKGGASDSCILLKKWLFTRTHEVRVSTNPVVQNLLYHQVSVCVCGGGVHIAQTRGG